MNKRKKKIIGVLQIVMALTLCISTVFASAYPSGTKTADLTPKTIKGSLVKTTDIDANDLRASYFDKDVVKSSEVKFSGERWVIIGFDGEDLYSAYEKDEDYNGEFSSYVSSVKGKSLKKSIEADHAAFLRTLDAKGIDYTYKYSYSVLNNGIALKVDSEAYAAIQGMKEVKSIEFSERYAEPKVAVKNDANVYTTGIYDSSNIEEQGEGMVVAILDTGLDYAHEAFRTMPKSPAWTKGDVAKKIADAKTSGKTFYANADVDDVYYNAKIPFAYDYADDDPDVYPSYSTHGTHVAGIVAGSSDYVVGENGETFVGVAPEAQLVICKVFTDNLDSDGLGGADTIDIISAVSDCVALGVDVINMSLGSSAGFAEESDDNEKDRLLNKIYASVKEAGISLVVAASNDYSSGFGGGNGTNLASNPDSGTVGSPSTYDSALSVASINGQKSTYIQANNTEDQVAFITEASDGDGNELDFVDQLYEKTGKTKGETLNFKYVVIGGVGRDGNYNTRVKRELADKAGYDGVIALVKRGDITFEEKVNNAIANGADACVIYNNVSGTIRMSLGEVNDPIPTCAITMDAGKKIVEGAEKSVGTMQICSDFKAGPFMSDFSSWGPMPDLQLKPEITAHGGEITSAVPGGYDIYSGTSMAAPNMAGAIALLRQNLKKQGLTGKELTARVNQVLMSTATIARNEENNPYSPRKQGAGLAGIKNAIDAESYITVTDENGNVRDKTKIELYDDKKRTGVYEFEFTINNLSGKAETYSPAVYVMTETLASDNKTVAEKADMLTDSILELTVDGVKKEGNVSVPANGTVKVGVKITLSAETKKKLDKNFKNGMYIEGFVSLAGVNETKVTIGLPYLAFYGDWNDAPLFDYSIYDIAESQKDTSVPEEDKLKASAAETRVLGRYYDDKYIISLGSYLYEMADSDVKIYAEKEKAAISIFDEVGSRSIYEVYMVYAGLLRSANTVDIVVTDAATGDEVYKKTQHKVSKSYAGGGANRGAAIMLEIDAKEWGLSANSTYNVSLKGTLDYEGGENPSNNSFDFTFTVDYEQPQALDYRIRFEPYTENKKVKYNIYMDVDVQDNQYVMDVMPCYIRTEKNGRYLTLATEHPIPVYGDKGAKSTVSFDITDYYDKLVKTGELYIVVEDYAMNQAMYQVSMASAIEYPDEVTISTDDGRLVKLDPEDMADGVSVEYPVYDLEMSINELYAPAVSTLPDATMTQVLSWYVTKGNEFVRASGGEIFATGAGRATLLLRDGDDAKAKTYAGINLTVTNGKLAEPSLDRIVLGSVFNSSKYVVGIDQSTLPTFTMNPNSSVQLKASVSPWYITDVEYSFKSSNENVLTVDAIGNIRTLKKGSALVTITVTDKREGMSGKTLSKTVRVEVGDLYKITNYTLYDYYGGEICEIPKDKNVMYIDEECFRYNTTLRKIILPSTVTEIPEKAFEGCTNLEEVVIPSQCTTIREGAFKDCKKLRVVTLEEFKDRENNTHEGYFGAITVGRSAFEGCTSLETINNAKRLTTAYDRAFANCTSLKEIDITELRVTGSEVFLGCTALEKVETSDFTSVGKEMFASCKSLKEFDFKGDYVPDGAFTDCTSLAKFTFAYKGEFRGIGENAFVNATELMNITLPAGNYTVGNKAFYNASLKTVEIGDAEVKFELSVFESCVKFASSATTGFTVNGKVNGESRLYKTVNGILYSKDMKTLIAVPSATESFTLPSSVTRLADGALAGLSIKGELDLTKVTDLGNYALSGSDFTSVKLNPSTTVIPEGLFSEAEYLTEVTGIENVTKIEAYGFYKAKTTNLTFPLLTEAGEYAFSESRIRSITADKLEVIGDSAFESSQLTEVNFPSARSIGTEAFANASALVKATFGGVTEMGEKTFRNAPLLSVVEFGQGTTVIAPEAFMSDIKRANLVEVVLPDGVKKIGDKAFANCVSITGINLNGTETVGEFAFYGCTNLKDVKFDTIVTIGEAAFSDTGVTAAELDKAKDIGAYAFNGSQLEKATFGALESVGAYAFSYTKLTEVVLPSSFDKVYKDYNWTEYDEKGRVDEVRSRKIYSYGSGAFSAIETLKSITANGKNIYSADGVLYAKTTDGNILLQYPAAKTGDNYETIADTISIANSAFMGVNILGSVKFVYTVAEIGDYAFFDSSVKEYEFNSVEAPALLSEFEDVDDEPYSVKKVMFGRNDANHYYGFTIYYANFYDYAAKVIYSAKLNAMGFGVPTDFGLKAIVPKNGKGYDTPIWNAFFTVERTSEILPDKATNAFVEQIKAIKAEKSLEELKNASSISEIEKIAGLTAAARKAYNAITSPDQLSLLTSEISELIDYETAIRAKKKEFGQPVEVKELQIATRPDKTRYVSGETFNAAGMVLKLIFADGSELVVTDFKTDKTVLNYGDEKVIVTCNYEGTDYSAELLLNIEEASSESGNSSDSQNGKSGCLAGALIGGGIGVAVIVAAVVVFFVLKKKKND